MDGGGAPQGPLLAGLQGPPSGPRSRSQSGRSMGPGSLHWVSGWSQSGLEAATGGARLAPQGQQRAGEVGGPPTRPDARHAGKPHFLLRGLQKTAELGARAGHPRGADRMAEGKAGGAAGLFAKQVQKKFSRAQEKVGTGLATCRSPLLATSGGPRHCEGHAGCSGGPGSLD